MNGFTLDMATAIRLAGLLYLLMPLSIWLVLHRGTKPAGLAAWCAGAGASGLAYLLVGLRGTLPNAVSIYLANALAIASFVPRIASLRMEAGQPAAWQRGFWLAALGTALFAAADLQSEALRVLSSLGLQALANAWLAWAAARLWLNSGLRTARAMALAFGCLAAVTVAAMVDVGLGGWPAVIDGSRAGVALAMVVAFVVSLYGNLAFMGLVFERAHHLELAQARELERVSAQRKAAEQQAAQLSSWLDERDELLRLLAHEVRQPLNNASAALQAAQIALSPLAADSQAAGQRVQRAELVLGQIIATLDNTLAATALLASPDRVERRDVDVDTLLALTIGDLDPAQRARVQLQSTADMRTALMDAGLMRLALRNLLCNALAYSAPGSPVVLRVSDVDEPLALVLEVLDRGQGIAPELAPRLFERGVRGNQGGPGHGLGLYVVRRVMELHGGEVDLRPNPGGGTIFRLRVTQDMPDRRRTRRPEAALTPASAPARADQPGLSSARNK